MMKNSNNLMLSRRTLPNIRAQQGWTMWSLMFVLGVVMFFAYVGMQLVPVYSANSNVKNAMQISVDGLSRNKISRAEIVRAMRSQLYLDGNDELIDYKEELNIERSQRELIVKVNYKRQIPLFFNLSLLAEFDNKVTKDLSSL